MILAFSVCAGIDLVDIPDFNNDFFGLFISYDNSLPWWGSKRLVAAFTGTDPVYVLDGANEDLAVTGDAGGNSVADLREDLLDHFVPYNHFDADLRQQIDIDLHALDGIDGVYVRADKALLRTAAHDAGNRHAAAVKALQNVLQHFQLLRAGNNDHFFHNIHLSHYSLIINKKSKGAVPNTTPLQYSLYSMLRFYAIRPEKSIALKYYF